MQGKLLLIDRKNISQILITEAATGGIWSKKMFLEILQNSQENRNLFSDKVALEQVFSCEFCGISKNTSSKERLRVTASVIISENKLWKALLYHSNFVNKITECNQKCWTFPFRSSFVLRQNRLFCYKTLYICT